MQIWFPDSGEQQNANHSEDKTNPAIGGDVLAQEQGSTNGGDERFECDEHGHVASQSSLRGDDLQARRADEYQEAHHSSFKKIKSARRFAWHERPAKQQQQQRHAVAQRHDLTGVQPRREVFESGVSAAPEDVEADQN